MDIIQVQQVMAPKNKKKSKKLKNNKKIKKQKFEQQMLTYPQTCYSCLNHPDSYLRLKPGKTVTNPSTCKSCGVKLCGLSGYLSCEKVQNCLNLCSVCRVCPSNHIIRKIFMGVEELKSFKCNGCKKQKQITEEETPMGCITCKYFVCVKCSSLSEMLWELEIEDELKSHQTQLDQDEEIQTEIKEATLFKTNLSEDFYCALSLFD